MAISEFGRIGRDAELRYTQNGDAVCNVPVAVDYGRKGQDGKKPTQWYEVALWGKQAEALAPYLLRGKQVFFTGTDLHVEQFQKNDGSQGVKLACRSIEIKFAYDGQSEQRQQPTPKPERQPTPRQQQSQQGAQGPDAYDDDIPFSTLHFLVGV